MATSTGETPTTSTRTWTLVVILILGLGVGWFIGYSQRPPQPPPQPTPQPQPSPAPTAQMVPTKVPTPPGPYPPANNWRLTVGPTACDVTQNGQKVPVAVIKKGLHWIRFTPNPNQTLSIIFHVPPTSQVPPTFPRPFKHMVLAGYDSEGYALWALVCDEHNNSCFTGPAERDASETYYKYDQILGGKLCDAGMIIQP
jgi:hypothetical protein